ncbi:MAG TPA: ATP-binding protein [Candidatus Hydrogenedens sp.]|nr:ATP-binding protein [Candidatus Hydrogenedens sp.]
MNNSIDFIAQSVIQNLESGVLVINDEGDILLVNPSALKHLKLKHHILQPGKNIFHIKELTPFVEIYKELLDKKESISRRKITLDIEEENILGLTSSLIKEGDKILGAVFLFTDLTQIKKLQHEAEVNKQLAQIGTLTASIVHEFRNPLGVISGMTEFLIQKTADKPELIKNLNLILKETEQLNLLVNQFLSFARPQEVYIQKQTTDFVIEKAINICSHIIEKHSAIIEVKKIPKNLQFIFADADKLSTAIANLIRNAIEVQMEQDKKWVRISVDSDGECIIIRIEDEGPGLPEKIKKHELFKPFVTKKKGGTGLGLSIVQRIVMGHRGWVNCHNRQPRGAIFEIGIPLEPAVDFPNEIPPKTG